jgi:hypothetical protein
MVPRMRRKDEPITRGAVSLPEEAIAAEMFKAGFKFEAGWLAKNREIAAQLALWCFEQGEPDALIKLLEAKFSMPEDALQHLGKILYASPRPLLCAVAAATRKKTGRKSGWSKYPKIWPVVAALYESELARAQKADDPYRSARQRAADAVAKMSPLKWLTLTPSAVLSIVTLARKAR